jgi:predicted metalloprotease with PDZ domain
VFIRRNPHASGGGTALARSFTFGWNEATNPTVDSLQDLLAHEMTHNWPKLDDPQHGDTAWYTEGAAEYYSLLLSLRAGVLNRDQFLERINGRASGYYTNPLRGLTNREAAEKFWSDWAAQRIPYGRGFMYLAQTDAKLRAASNGKRSLDDIVLELNRRVKAKEPHGIADWVALVGRELGPVAKQDYDAMVAGRTIVLPANSFAACFQTEPFRERAFELGFDPASLTGSPRTVKGLVAGTAADRAGVREGDEIIEATETLKAQNTQGAEMVMKVRRGSEDVQIAYVPRGAKVEGWHWKKRTGAAKNCKL